MNRFVILCIALVVVAGAYAQAEPPKTEPTNNMAEDGGKMVDIKKEVIATMEAEGVYQFGFNAGLTLGKGTKIISAHAYQPHKVGDEVVTSQVILMLECGQLTKFSTIGDSCAISEIGVYGGHGLTTHKNGVISSHTANGKGGVYIITMTWSPEKK